MLQKDFKGKKEILQTKVLMQARSLGALDNVL
jgi:hypothetical protein